MSCSKNLISWRPPQTRFSVKKWKSFYQFCIQFPLSRREPLKYCVMNQGSATTSLPVGRWTPVIFLARICRVKICIFLFFADETSFEYFYQTSRGQSYRTDPSGLSDGTTGLLTCSRMPLCRGGSFSPRLPSAVEGDHCFGSVFPLYFQMEDLSDSHRFYFGQRKRVSVYHQLHFFTWIMRQRQKLYFAPVQNLWSAASWTFMIFQHSYLSPHIYLDMIWNFPLPFRIDFSSFTSAPRGRLVTLSLPCWGFKVPLFGLWAFQCYYCISRFSE